MVTGHKTEGIFRVPGKNDEISRLKAQFNKVLLRSAWLSLGRIAQRSRAPRVCREQMDYTITSDDPNDLGGCLKMWFRELKDPLIPNSI